MSRRLAAILAADIVGYSRMMGTDEVGTLASLRSFRSEVFGPTVAGHHGQVVKSMGDGWLVEFASARDAVTCAMHIQDRLAGQPTLALRIGLHTGDITFSDDDLFGDGVNVAARLEALAEPGQVLISDAVHGMLDGTQKPAFDDLGNHQLKNIDRTVRVWRWHARQPETDQRSAAVPELSREGFPRLTLRPFSTTDPRAEIRDLVDAITSDVGSYLGSVSWLVSAVSDTAAADGYALTAALRARGDRVRLEGRLKAPDGAQLWSGKFDGDLADSFDFQDATGEEIAATVSQLVLDSESAALSQVPLNQMTGEQCLLAGKMASRDFSEASFVEALGYYERAIDRDPELVEAYGEAILWVLAGRTVGFGGSFRRFEALCDDWQRAAQTYARKLPLLDLALALGRYQRDGAIAPLRATMRDLLRLAPFDAEVLVYSGWCFLWSGEPEAAKDCFVRHRSVSRFGPFTVGALGGLATASLMIGDYDEAIRYAQIGLSITDTYPTLLSALAAAHALDGRQNEAEVAFARYHELVPDRTISSWKAVNDYGGSAGGARYFDGLRKAGMPE